MLHEPDTYVGTKLSFDEPNLFKVEENVSNTWNSMTKLFEYRHNQELRCKYSLSIYLPLLNENDIRKTVLIVVFDIN